MPVKDVSASEWRPMSEFGAWQPPQTAPTEADHFCLYEENGQKIATMFRRDAAGEWQYKGKPLREYPQWRLIGWMPLPPKED